MIFRSVARVSDDNPDTHKLRLADDDDDDDELDLVDDLLLAPLPDAFDPVFDDSATHSRTHRTEFMNDFRIEYFFYE